jgi:hypothetical protein
MEEDILKKIRETFEDMSTEDARTLAHGIAVLKKEDLSQFRDLIDNLEITIYAS